MSEIKIEILDYIYGTGDNLIDCDDYSSKTSNWSVSDYNTAVMTNDPNGTGVQYLSDVCPVVAGIEYRISFDVSGFSGTGSMGFVENTLGLPTTFRRSGNGSVSGVWTSPSSGSLDLYGTTSNAGTITNISVQETSTIDWDKSIIGELDVTSHEDFPLAFTFSIADIKKLDSRSGTYSKTFKVPATKHNNKLLKHIYRTNSNTDNDILAKKKCRISVNGIQVLDGLIKITAIGGYDTVATYYSCVFFGNNLSWAKEIGDRYMSEIDWGSDNEGLKLDKTNISNTWAYSDCNSANESIVYPLASYGKVNSDGGEVGAVQLLETYNEATGFNANANGYYGFDNNGNAYPTPEPELDWRPMVWVKDTIDKIFENSGYHIVSSFMETDMFKRLVWALPNAKYSNKIEREDLYGFDSSFSGDSHIQDLTLTSSSNSWNYDHQLIDLNNAGVDFNVNSDNSSGWDVGQNFLTLKEYGFYNIKLANFGCWYDITTTTNPLSIEYITLQVECKTEGHSSWNLIDTGISGFNGYFQSNSTQSGDFNFPTINISRYFNKGDKVRILVKARFKHVSSIDLSFFGSSTPMSATTSLTPNATFSSVLNSEIMEYGQTYNLSDVIDPEWKQMDFLKGIIHAFNLQMTTDSSTGEIHIETYNSFYKSYGDALDWNGKLDRGSEITSKWINNSLKRNVVFKYKTDDKDAKIKPLADAWWRKIQDYYPYFEDLGEQIEQGESKFENPFFAGTYVTRDADLIHSSGVPRMFTAAMWEGNYLSASKGRGEKGNDFLPRLLYWNNEIDMSGFASYSIQNWDTSYYIGDTAGQYIPQATSVDKHNINSPNLCYGNVGIYDYDWTNGGYSARTTKKGLYETYYKNQLEAVKANPRLIIAYFDLKVSDIINLDLSRLVYFNEVYYKINKIIDYVPLKNTPTKIELIEYIFTGEFQSGDVLGVSGTNVSNPGGGVSGEDGGIPVIDDSVDFD